MVLRLSCLGRYLAPARRPELEAEELSALRRSAARRVADQRAVAHPEALSVRRLRREAVSFRRPEAYQEVGLCAAAAYPEVSSSRHLRRAAVHQDATGASSVRRWLEALSKALRLAARLSKARWSAAPLWWAASPWVRHPAFPAHAWCQPEAARCAVAARLEQSWLRHLRREVLLLPPAEMSASCAQAVSRSGEAVAVGSDARAAQPWAVPVASGQPPVVVRQEVSAAPAELP